MRFLRHAAGLLAGTVIFGCADNPPTGAGPADEMDTGRAASPLMVVMCDASITSGSVTCRAPDGSVSVPGRGALLIGKQNVHVKVTTAAAVYTPADSTFAFDLTVQNLIPQALATLDGVSGHPDGVRVFFSSGPTVSAGSGVAEVKNASGTATFTNPSQPYFQYAGTDLGADGMLSANEVSAAKQWQLRIESGVTSFTFMLLVSTEVQYPSGYITVSPPVDSLVAGTSVPLTATVRDAFGAEIAGQSVRWGTGNGTVGAVDGNGVVSGLAPGNVTITATSGARTGTASISVCPAMAVGTVYTATMPAAASLCFGADAGQAAEYTYIPVNHSNASALSLTLLANGIAAVTGPPSPNLMVPSGTMLVESSNHQASSHQSDGHFEFLERDRSLAESLLRKKGTRVSRTSDPLLRKLIVPGTPAVGDLWALNVASGCSGARDDRQGRVVSIGQHVIIVADTLNPAGGFTTAQYDSIALEFDSLVYAVDSANFGAPTDLDANGRAVAFYTRAVNELSPPASSAVVAGYVTSRDLFSSAPTSCPRSNEGEIFYMLVPDPTGAVNSNVRTVSYVRGGTVGTLAHEFQHLINSSRRIYLEGTSTMEEVWLNEGLSHIAEELIFFRTSLGLSPGSNIALSDLTTGPNASRRVAAFNTYANQNYGRLRSWLQRPDTAGAFKNSDRLAVRGAIWAFLRYAADRKGGAQTSTWYDLVNSSSSGKTNLTEVFGGTPDEWLRDFTAAMYADDAVAGVAATYTQPTWNFRSVYGGLGGYPLGVRSLSDGVGLTLSYSAGGGGAYARFGIPAGGFASVTSLSGGIPPTSPYSLIVVRTK